MNHAILNFFLAATIALLGYWMGGALGYAIAFAILWFCFGEGDARREEARRAENRDIGRSTW